MQISRHWRMNGQRYRLEGVRYRSGQVALQERPVEPPEENELVLALPVARELARESVSVHPERK